MFQRAQPPVPSRARSTVVVSPAPVQRAARGRPLERGQVARSTRLGHHFGRVRVSAPPAAPAAAAPIQARATPPAAGAVIQRFAPELWSGARSAHRNPKAMWQADEQRWAHWEGLQGSKSGNLKQIAHAATAPLAYAAFGGAQLGGRAAYRTTKAIWKGTHKLGKALWENKGFANTLGAYHARKQTEWGNRSTFYNTKIAGTGGVRKGLWRLAKGFSYAGHGIKDALGYGIRGLGAGLGYGVAGLASGATYAVGGLTGLAAGGVAGGVAGALGTAGGALYGLARTGRALAGATPAVGEHLANQAPSVEGVEANFLQAPQTAQNLRLKSGDNLTGALGRSVQAGTALQEAGSLAQMLGGIGGMFKHGYKWARGPTAVDRALAKRQFKEAAWNAAQGTTSTGRFIMQGIGQHAAWLGAHAGKALGKAAPWIGKAAGPVGAALSAAQGFVSGKRAVSAGLRARRLGRLAPGPNAPLVGTQVSSQRGQEVLEYARRKNRWQLRRGALGATAGALGALGGAAVAAAAFGAANAWNPVGWGLLGASAAIGLGIGAHKLWGWGRKKFQAGKQAGYGNWEAFHSIFTKGSKRIRREATANLPGSATKKQMANRLAEREGHARWLSEKLQSATAKRAMMAPLSAKEQDAELIFNALGLANKRNEAEAAGGHELIMHKLRSSG